MKLRFAILSLLLVVTSWAEPFDVKKTETVRRLKSYLDAVPAIDTHDHLKPFATIEGPCALIAAWG